MRVRGPLFRSLSIVQVSFHCAGLFRRIHILFDGFGVTHWHDAPALPFMAQRRDDGLFCMSILIF